MRKFLVATGITILFWAFTGLLVLIMSNELATAITGILFILVFSWTIIYVIVKNMLD